VVAGCSSRRSHEQRVRREMGGVWGLGWGCRRISWASRMSRSHQSESRPNPWHAQPAMGYLLLAPTTQGLGHEECTRTAVCVSHVKILATRAAHRPA
jgi:hypothetical protein